MRVLLIEDDILIGNGLKMGLPAMGFAVDWFKEGPLGMKALASAEYDAVTKEELEAFLRQTVREDLCAISVVLPRQQEV